MAKKKQIGSGAICTVLLKYLHPGKTISDKFPNRTAQQRLEGLIAQRQEMRKVKKSEQLVVVFRHAQFENVEIYCVKRWCKVISEGAEEHFFPATAEVEAVEVVPEEQEAVTEISNEVFNARNNSEDIANVRAMGFDVDDDNLPLDENNPDEGAERPAVNAFYEGQVWGWQGFDNRRQANIQNVEATIGGLSIDVVSSLSYITMFFYFFPKPFLEDVILKETNKHVTEKISIGEMLRWLGIWLFMATISGFNRRDFWSMKNVEREEGAPYRFNDWMSSRRFEEILQALRLTDRNSPPFKDRFWEVRQLIETWNKHTQKHFSPSWISCLDESMSIWFNKYSCPGWIFCPRKPHPFGNEYHSICCGITGIMFAIEMVEGKDAPAELRVSSKAKTSALLLRLCKSIYGTGKIVVLDSGFCVLEALIQLRKQWGFAGALIKKRKYWPKHVPGEAIDDAMTGKNVGECDSLSGSIDDIKYDIFCMKEPDYVMKIMSTYGALIEPPDQRESIRTYKKGGLSVTDTFKYKEPFANHFAYRHAVDDHNNLRHRLPSLEDTWVTHRWPLRVFSFILAISEVNTYKAMKYFVWDSDENIPTLLQFRKTLALLLINNDYLKREDQKTTRKSNRKRQREHCLSIAPPHASKFSGGRWKKTAKARYQQYVCRGLGCRKQTRTYCACDVGIWLCKDCHLKHVLEVQYGVDNATI